MEITLRAASKDDYEFARGIHHSAYRDWTIAQFGSWDLELQDRFFAESWDRWNYQIIRGDGTDCGYCAVESNAKEVHLREFAIRPERQGKGVGTAYLRMLIRDVQNAGKPLRLRAFRANKRAIALYKQLGFLQTGQTDLQYLFEWPK